MVEIGLDRAVEGGGHRGGPNRGNADSIAQDVLGLHPGRGVPLKEDREALVKILVLLIPSEALKSDCPGREEAGRARSIGRPGRQGASALGAVLLHGWSILLEASMRWVF